MGVDYSAAAVIGMRVHFPLYTDIEVKQFDREYPEGTRFDPKTGKSLYKMVKLPIEGYDQDAYTFHGYPLVSGTDDDCVVSLHHAESDEDNLEPGFRVAIPDDLFERIGGFQAVMKRAGVWKPEEFGLWSVLCCSY